MSLSSILVKLSLAKLESDAREYLFKQLEGKQDTLFAYINKKDKSVSITINGEWQPYKTKNIEDILLELASKYPHHVKKICYANEISMSGDTIICHVDDVKTMWQKAGPIAKAMRRRVMKIKTNKREKVKYMKQVLGQEPDGFILFPPPISKKTPANKK